MKPNHRAVFPYFGGKWYIGDWIAENLPPGRTLVITHGGGGSPLWHVPLGRYAVEVLNDIDARVVNFFRVCRERPGDLAAMTLLTPYSRAEWRHCRDTADEGDELERARKFITVAKQSRYGAWGRGWSCTIEHAHRGIAQSLSNWLRTPETILAVAGRLARVQLECRDAIDVVRTYDRPDTVFYVDPPYCHDVREPGSCDVYRHEYTREDHEELLRELLRIKGKAAISGYRNPLYDSTLKDWRTVARNVCLRARQHSRKAGDERAMRTEILWIKE